MESIWFNNLEARLAFSEEDLRAAQSLRYRIFYEEMGASPDQHCQILELDQDQYDFHCDHLLVVDNEKSSEGCSNVVGTYRLLRSSIAKKTVGFYSENEFNLSAIKNYPCEIMELGRSCIAPAYRRRGVMQLLWKGILNYSRLHEIKLMFGCGSLPGTDVKDSIHTLSYLHHYHLAPEGLRPRALDSRYLPMNCMSMESLDQNKARMGLPPLLRGYVCMGGYVGDGAVIDYNFNTIDVCVVVETDKISGKYFRQLNKTGVTALEKNKVNIAA
tara:strand:- start:858 stop:1673 length:816 start_codon:yes stop_codon:yes gene_type:complete